MDDDNEIPPPPELTLEFEEVKILDDEEEDLTKLKLKKVPESEKHYVSVAEMMAKLEKNAQKEIYSKYMNNEYSKEYYDSEEEFAKKIKILSEMVRKCKRLVFFTGAGISTSAGIPDFRGPEGEWTILGNGRKRKKKGVSFINAFPTSTHMSIIKLIQEKKCKYVISQNCDGLHLKSGIKRTNISELHGCCNIEFCEKCGKEYYRDFYCSRKVLGRDHFTGRFCTQKECGKEGRLMNSTIDFEQGLPLAPLKKAWVEVEKCDLMIAMGSSLQVNPAALMPKRVLKRKKNLVIINLQRTPLWNKGALNIHAKIDDVMKAMMKELKLDIPKWEIQRKIQVQYLCEKGKHKSIFVSTSMVQDESIHHNTYMKRVLVKYKCNKDGSEKVIKLEKEPFVFDVNDIWENKKSILVKKKDNIVRIEIEWMKHYDEPNLGLIFNVKKVNKKQKELYNITYDPHKIQWNHKKGLTYKIETK